MDRAQTVKTITAQLRDVPMKPGELVNFMLMYVMDRDFDRAGICEAEKAIKQERGWK